METQTDKDNGLALILYIMLIESIKWAGGFAPIVQIVTYKCCVYVIALIHSGGGGGGDM